MRVRVAILVIYAALAAGSRADTIHLKNGRTIVADQVHEKGTHLEYEIGDDSYAIPKALVDHVDAGGLPLHSASANSPEISARDLPEFTAPDSIANEGDLVSKIIKSGEIDSSVLAGLESKGNAELSASANFIAGKHAFDHGNIAEARRYFESALGFQPNSPTILIYYAALLVRTGSARHALSFAQRAVQAAPDSADAHTMLGYAQFASDRTREAVASWTRSLELRPDPIVKRLLAKAQREQSAEAEFTERESTHFVLHFEGKQSSEALRGQIIAALEADYDQLVRDFGNPPRDNIVVTLYTDQTFFDVTQAPSWSGAINDGKLRVPISGITSVTPTLAKVLKHELTHSFITQMSGGRCPSWLNEGVAQLLEPRSLGSDGRPLARLFKAQGEIPLGSLEGSFTRFSGAQASIAYAESLAAVSFINDSYGIGDIQRILQSLAQGSSTEVALRTTLHSGYGQLESDLAGYLKDKYGE